MRVIIFDSNVGGHRPSWAACMAQASIDAGHELFLAAPFGEDRVDFWMEQIQGGAYHRITVNHRRGLPDLPEALRLAETHVCDLLVLPYFDSVPEEIAHCGGQLRESAVSLAGVVFRPETPRHGLADHLNYALLKLVRTRAGKQARFALRQQIRWARAVPALEAVTKRGGSIKLLSLDSGDAFETLRLAVPNASVRRLTCDPWLSRSAHTKAVARERLKLPKDRFIFLHCGNFSKEKGLADAVAAWSRMPEDLQEKSVILRAGKVPDKLLAARLRGFGILEDDYIPQDRLDELYAACDCVLAPYRNHARSSGVLIHAAASERPVIAPDFAVVGDYVIKHELGYIYEHLNVESLSAAMIRALRGGYEPSVRARAFVAHNTRERFIAEVRSFFFELAS